MNKKQKEAMSHIEDVKQRLIDGEITLSEDGRVLRPEEAEEYVKRNEVFIILLGREGFNPFNTVQIIEGRNDYFVKLALFGTLK